MSRAAAPWRPGRDPRAVRHPGRAGRGDPAAAPTRRVVVVGGGIAGLAAATALAEGGVQVTVVEREQRLGGRARSWPVGDDGTRTMSRGFHAFFRQYYNLRELLRRADPDLEHLLAVPDYPLVGADGARDSFRHVPRTPPWNMAAFVAGSETFRLRDLAAVDLRAAFEMLAVDFPRTFTDYDGVSAAAFLDRLRFPDAARHLALEVFARSFFAPPEDFAAGELVAMFHTYFLGSAEGLLFDVPDDDYDTALWAPLGRHLAGLGVDVRTGAAVHRLESGPDGVRVAVAGEDLSADAVVLALDPGSLRTLVAASPAGDEPWRARVDAIRTAPPFGVLRLWLDRPVEPTRAAFLGTTGFAGLDNISVLERFEAGAARWRAIHGGSVVELHAYALPDTSPAPSDAAWPGRLRADLDAVYPELRGAVTVAQEWLVREDCWLLDPRPWHERVAVRTPDPRVVLAGDGVRCELPVALMERAATTGLMAANTLLDGWGLGTADVWSVPMRGRHEVVNRLVGRPGRPQPFSRIRSS